MKLNFKWGPDAFRRLNGVFCVYKPANMAEGTVKKIIRKNLVRDLNLLPCYEQEIYQFPTRLGGNDNVHSLVSTNLPCEPAQLFQHRLVMGQRYTEEDIRLNHLHSFGYRSSGVLVMGLGKRATSEYFSLLALAKYLRVYHVKGRFGYSTQNFYPDGHFVERSTYNHITRGKLDKVCGSAQAAHQKLIFQCAGVDLQSQEAYELASQGLVRPSSQHTGPLLYSVKCIHFNPPDFTLEVHSINETDEFLANFIHDIGLKLRSSAVCTHIHRLRYGHFGLDHALLTKEWTLHEIVKNIDYCYRQLTPNKLFTNISMETTDNRKRQNIGPGTVSDVEGTRSGRLGTDDARKQQSRTVYNSASEPGTSFDPEVGIRRGNYNRRTGGYNAMENATHGELRDVAMTAETNSKSSDDSELGTTRRGQSDNETKWYDKDEEILDTETLVRNLLNQRNS